MATAEFEKIAEDFEFVDDWEDRYRYIIDLGKAMDPLEDALKVPATRVDGCASQVWIVPDVRGSGPEATISFRGDSDAMIVRGLIAVLHALYSGQRADDISRTDALSEMRRLGLDQHLSSQRSNGLRAMIGRITAIAETAKGAA